MTTSPTFDPELVNIALDGRATTEQFDAFGRQVASALAHERLLDDADQSLLERVVEATGGLDAVARWMWSLPGQPHRVAVLYGAADLVSHVADDMPLVQALAEYIEEHGPQPGFETPESVTPMSLRLRASAIWAAVRRGELLAGAQDARDFLDLAVKVWTDHVPASSIATVSAARQLRTDMEFEDAS